MKKKVIISACILGEYCRYDGKTKSIPTIIEKYKEYEIIPFCPEAPIFGTPRERINVVFKEGQNRIITDQGKLDVTQKLQEEIEQFIKKHPQPDAIVLKAKSPSCGYKTTPILDENKNIIKYGNGLATQIFLQRYSKIQIEDENHEI